MILVPLIIRTIKLKFNLLSCLFILLSLVLTTTVSAQSFVDFTENAAIVTQHQADKMSTGIAVADFDNNGWPDLFYTGYYLNSFLYFNNGNETFSTHNEFTIPDLSNMKCGSVSAADYDNDGWTDLYVACLGSNYLFHNEYGSGFTDVSVASGTQLGGRSEAVSWADLNNDGWLDLIVANHPLKGTPDLNNPNELDHFFINNQDGTFHDIYTSMVAEEIGRHSLAMLVTDVDMDNDADIYFANDRHDGNVLLRNDGPGCGAWCFTNIADLNGASHSAYCMGVSASDFDNDGDFDLSYSSIDEHIFLEHSPNQGINTFTNIAPDIGVDISTGYGWGTLFFDANNDQWDDLFLATNGGQSNPVSNVLSINNQDGSFSDQTQSSGLTDNNPAQSVVWLDFNRDGKLDLSYGWYNMSYRLMKNTTQSTHHWIAFQLMGRDDVNRDAIGSRITLNMNNGLQLTKELRAGESRGSNNQALIHFGLGTAQILSAQITWPNGLTETISQFNQDTFNRVEYSPPGIIFSAGYE